MPFNLKEAAENLLNVANALEKEAFDRTFFVCQSCNHTASLTSINAKRNKVAKEMGVKNVNTVTVNEKVSCPACDGVLEYVPTDESSKYYVEAAEGAPLEIAPPSDVSPDMPKDELLPPPEKKKPPKEEVPEDTGSIFAPVDEREKDEELNLDFPEGEGKSEDEPPEMPPEGDKPPEMPPEGEKSPEMSPEGDKPPEMSPEGEKSPEMPPEGEKPPEMPPEGDKPPEMSPEGEKPPEEAEMPPVVEEEVPLLEPEKKPKKKKEKVEFPKEDVPKFEKMPKDASDDAAYQASLKKYMF